MPAKAFWNAIDELRDKFRSGGATHQARIDYLIESVRAAPPPVQRKMLTVLSDVADGIEDLQCLLLAILPPEVTDRTQADENDDAA